MCDMYTTPVNYGDEPIDSPWTSMEEDKVILETEITLITGPNITMKIHEESRCGSVNSEEDVGKQGVIKVLQDDSESDFYEERMSPRTPRKVRFGGESFKLRTPESDSSQEDGIEITVTDTLSIKTKKSLIPVRVSSLPSTPQKRPQHYNSAPNLSTGSKIPLRKDTKATNKTSLRPKILKHSRAEDVFSPIPIHNEIEVFHNLTRSPVRSRSNSLVEGDKEDKRPTLQQSLSSLTSDDELLTKSEALEGLVNMLKEPTTCESLEAGPAALLFEALFACHHRDRLHNLADDAFTILIQNLRPNILEQCLPRLAVISCKIGSASGVRCALAIMKKLPPKKLQLEVISKGFGHRTREGALQILMACARLYPSHDVESVQIAEFAAFALKDRRRKVRHAALETLAAVAQLLSVQEVVTVVENTIKEFSDFDDIVKIVRTRLSRKQLPTVNLDGAIRYSSPTDQSETDWISGGGKSATAVNNVVVSPMSSASSSNQSVNYWMHNGRHENWFNKGSTLVRQLSDRRNEEETNALDDSKLWTLDPRKGPKSTPLRPVYILQPELSTSNSEKNGRGHRKYDRGRSFSPPKHFKAVPVVPLQSDLTDYRAGFRKSFSSDQLYHHEGKKSEPYSMSSRSSSTSTGSSTKSGYWHRDFRSGIPVPVPEKLKVRHTSSNATLGPMIVKRSAATSPLPTPVKNEALPLPAARSGSQSSGYYTPSPPDTTHPPAFIKMDSEERPSSGEPLQDLGNGSSKSVDGEEIEQDAGSPTPSNCLGERIHDSFSSVETIGGVDEVDNALHRPPSRSVILPETALSEVKRKSSSVVDLPSFLPKIPLRKNINSAPPRNEDFINNNPEPPNMPTGGAVTITKTKLERRFSRTTTRKSIKSEDRTPRLTSKPKDVLQQVLQQLENPNWETTVEGLQGLSMLARTNPDVIEQQIHQVCFILAKHIKNLRSQVSRSACTTASELFLSCRKGLEMELEEIACPLLQRTADTNRFLRADANAALDIMCEHLPAHRIIPVITSRGCVHQNAVVRAASIRLLGDTARRLGPERVFQLSKDLRDKILVAGSNALADGNLESRSQAKSLFKYLMSHPNFQKCLHEAVPQNILRHISKSLASIKYDS